MIPNKEPHEEKRHPPDRAAGRAFNTPENATKAVATSRISLSNLVPGKVWNHIAPRGEFEIKACLMLADKPVSALHFSPEDGSLLPKGLHALSAGKEDVVPIVEKKLKTILEELSILEGAEFREPEFCWAIPLAHQGRIVGHIKISADGSEVVSDKKTLDELEKLKEQ